MSSSKPGFQRRLSASAAAATANGAHKGKTLRCWNCGQEGHHKDECVNPKLTKEERKALNKELAKAVKAKGKTGHKGPGPRGPISTTSAAHVCNITGGNNTTK
ncbi:hypothetical protein MAPG_03624 [Magnaporthiopsis poae ATCC 64411]|uniref:CCHC-type domain-containing protein n=1 Tax=Magnaporthiopsis poae (strain ATCC 64411 / 73-15) TaxID=644358 RepID=A0A0C4DUI5_MAGP6|nr:hypothetical protein MAPG_03624 [Magnaporthiopsis poae ATCC 64411]